MRARLTVALVLAAAFAVPAIAQQQPDPEKRYRIFLSNGNCVEGNLRFDGGSAVIFMSLGKMVVPKERVTGFVDPKSGVMLDWRDHVKPPAKPADSTSTDASGTSAKPADTTQPTDSTKPEDTTGPKDSQLVKVESALTEWSRAGYEEPGRMAAAVKSIVDPPAPFIATNVSKMAPSSWDPACRALVALEDRSVTTILRDVLAAKASDLRLCALRAMINLAGAPEDYVAMLNDPDERIRLVALEGIGGLSDSRFLSFIPDLLLDDVKSVRTGAADILVRKATEFGMRDDAASNVADRLDRAASGQRELLIDTLGRLGTESAVTALAPLLGSDDPIEPKSVAVALSKIDEVSAREALREALAGATADERLGFVIQLMESCERQKDIRATPALAEFLDHENRTIANRAQRALEAVTKQRGIPANSGDWLKWYHEQKLSETEPPKGEKPEKEGTP